MSSLEVEGYVDAPIERVWTFHSSVEGLEALTPGIMGLEVREVRDAGGRRIQRSEELDVGYTIDMRLSPLGLWPSVDWTARITGKQENRGSAWFEDEMVEGPFESWRHRHVFTSEGGGTRIRDEVEYELPRWFFLGRGSSLVEPQMKLVFRGRHRLLRRMLE
ncbi:MAG: SRPBCC family protein [Halobacteriales archaeon]